VTCLPTNFGRQAVFQSTNSVNEIFSMESTYFRRLETAFNSLEKANTDAGRQEIISTLTLSDPDLVDELETLFCIKKEQDLLKGQASAKSLFDLLLTTLGEGSRKDSSASLLHFLAETHGTSSSDEIASLRGFSFRKLIATGATGFVFEGWDEVLCREVAIKVLAPSIANGEIAKSRFLSEARLATSIDHKNVIDVYHVSTDQDSILVFFVMEWFEGKTLQHWLDNNDFGSATLRSRMSIFKELVLGLDAIHETGIIHRDLKPGNVMINEKTGDVKILDFGLAINPVVDAEQVTVAGTPLYMAPEQMEGAPLTTKTDLFALAAIACVLFTGTHPFEARDLDDLGRQLLKGPDGLRANPSIDPNLKVVLLKGLCRKSSGRYENAKSFGVAIENAFAGDCLPELNNSTLPLLVPLESQSPDRFRDYSSWLVNPLAWVVVICLSVWGAYLLRGDAVQKAVENPSTEVEVVKPQKGKWIDEQHFENYEGIRFVQIKIGNVGRDEKEAFARENPELSKNLGWANYIPSDRWLVMEDLVSSKQYNAIMRKEGEAPADEEVISNISYVDVNEFCKKLTENCPNGLQYSPLSRNLLSYAMFGKRHFIDGVPLDDLSDTFLNMSNGQLPGQQNPTTLPLISGLFGQYWEWTDSYTIKSSNPDGIVSYKDRLEMPYERSYQIMGGGQSDIFVHRSNMAYGMNDFYHDSDNLLSSIEEDGQTSYLKPIICGQPGWVSYRYQFPKGIRNASIGNCLHLLREDSQGGIKLRYRKSELDPILDDCDWLVVFDKSGPKTRPISDDAISPVRFDVSKVLAGAIEVELKYWVQSPQEPTYYEQIARTVDTFSLLERPMEFEVVAEGRLESMRQYSTAPASFRHPLISFRVMAKWQDDSD
jgi:serine/threonine protein kinase